MFVVGRLALFPLDCEPDDSVFCQIAHAILTCSGDNESDSVLLREKSCPGTLLAEYLHCTLAAPTDDR